MVDVGDEKEWIRFCGVHRWQHVPQGSRKRHTTTVTVVLLEDPDGHGNTNEPLDETTLREEFYRGTGKGGQHRNKVSTAVRLVHTPTGLTVATERGRSQAQNRTTVRRRLQRQLDIQQKENRRRREQQQRQDQLTPQAPIVTHNEQRNTVSSTSGWMMPQRRFTTGKWD